MFKAIRKSDRLIVAAKCIDIDGNFWETNNWITNYKLETCDDMDDIHQEIEILSQINSEFVTKYYTSFIHESKLYIIMEYCSGGSILELVSTLSVWYWLT